MTCASCQMPLDREEAWRSVWSFTATKDGVTELLQAPKGVYCVGCSLDIKESLSRIDSLPEEVIKGIVKPATSRGYVLNSNEGIRHSFVRVAELDKLQMEWVPSEGGCHSRLCEKKATMKPMITIPLEVGEAHIFGGGFCGDHIRQACDLRQVDPGQLRVALLKIASAGFKPDASRITIGAVLMEYNPQDSVTVTDDVSRDAELHKRRSQNANNN